MRERSISRLNGTVGQLLAAAERDDPGRASLAMLADVVGASDDTTVSVLYTMLDELTDEAVALCEECA